MTPQPHGQVDELEPVVVRASCPACQLPIRVTLGLPSIDDDGSLTVDAHPAGLAMHLHVTRGCPRMRRTRPE